MEDENCWDRYSCIWKVILEWFVAGEIETRYLLFLVKESEGIPKGGMEGVCRVAVGCAQPSGWKLTSADPNVDWFTEWRWLL